MTGTGDDEFAGRPELVKKRARANLASSFFFWTILGFLVVGMGIQVVDTAQTVSVQKRLLSCTTPGLKCHNESQKRTALVVSQLIEANTTSEIQTRRIVVLAAACSRFEGNTTIAQIEQCVTKQLEKEGTDQ